MNRVVVVGLPRSGTSWVGRVLARTQDTMYVAEPDNESKNPFALRAKRALGRFPLLLPDDEAPAFETLWNCAFGIEAGRRRSSPSGGFTDRMARWLLRNESRERLQSALVCGGSLSLGLRLAGALASPTYCDSTGRNSVVKTVHSVMAIEWLTERFKPQVVVIFRHPLNTIASWLDLPLMDRDRRLDEHAVILERLIERRGLPLPGAGASDLERTAWQFGLLTLALEEAAERHPEWHAIVHEDFCSSPHERFNALGAELGLGWTQAAEDFLTASDRPGTGFTTNRIAHEQPERWRSRLHSDDVAQIARVLERFPIATWPHTTV